MTFGAVILPQRPSQSNSIGSTAVTVLVQRGRGGGRRGLGHRGRFAGRRLCGSRRTRSRSRSPRRRRWRGRWRRRRARRSPCELRDEVEPGHGALSFRGGRVMRPTFTWFHRSSAICGMIVESAGQTGDYARERRLTRARQCCVPADDPALGAARPSALSAGPVVVEQRTASFPGAPCSPPYHPVSVRSSHTPQLAPPAAPLDRDRVRARRRASPGGRDHERPPVHLDLARGPPRRRRAGRRAPASSSRVSSSASASFAATRSTGCCSPRS